MEDIAAEAEVGKGTIYRYFSDKEELFVALLERSSRQLLARLDDVKQRSGSPGDRLHSFVNTVIGFFDERPHLFDLIQRAEVMRGRGSDFPWQRARDELFQLFLDLLKEGNERSAFRIRDPELAMLMMLGGLRTIIRFGPRPRPADLVARIVESFLNGADAGTAPGRMPETTFSPDDDPVAVLAGRCKSEGLTHGRNH
jgi:AcrR family transcriptional regulator